jgi:hypothetical protein
MADCVFTYYIAADRLTSDGKQIYIDVREPKPIMTGVIWEPGAITSVTSARPEGFTAHENWQDMPIKLVPVSGDCMALQASNFADAEDLRNRGGNGLDERFRNGLLELGIDFPGNPPGFDAPDWLLYALVGVGVLSAFNASKRGVRLVNGAGMTVGAWAAYRLIKGSGTLNGAQGNRHLTKKLSAYTIAKNCADLSDCRAGLEEVEARISKRLQQNMNVPYYYFQRRNDLLKKINLLTED